MEDSWKSLGECTAEVVDQLVWIRTRDLLAQARRCERIMEAKAANPRWLKVWTAAMARVEDIDIRTRLECK
jgi:hypothetical protein